VLDERLNALLAAEIPQALEALRVALAARTKKHRRNDDQA
jgi:hypothetical protein